ncbi:hypothetical protein NKH18_45180 [Streptomyces sp. M10(2022)]
MNQAMDAMSRNPQEAEPAQEGSQPAPRNQPRAGRTEERCSSPGPPTAPPTRRAAVRCPPRSLSPCVSPAARRPARMRPYPSPH